MQHQTIVSEQEWLDARRKFLQEEKEFTRLRDKLSQHRRELPWVKVDKDYEFDGSDGKQSLSDLFEGHSQLIVYHCMFGLEWEEGGPSCSYLADNFNGIDIHLKHRDANLVAVSRAPLAILQAYQQRMGWDFKWVSSIASDFKYD